MYIYMYMSIPYSTYVLLIQNFAKYCNKRHSYHIKLIQWNSRISQSIFTMEYKSIYTVYSCTNPTVVICIHREGSQCIHFHRITQYAVVTHLNLLYAVCSNTFWKSITTWLHLKMSTQLGWTSQTLSILASLLSTFHQTVKTGIMNIIGLLTLVVVVVALDVRLAARTILKCANSSLVQ